MAREWNKSHPHVHVIAAAVATDGWGIAAIMRESLNDNEVGSIL
jgi:hypothetical protein